MIIEFGTRTSIVPVLADDREYDEMPGEQVLHFNVPDDLPPMDMLRDVSYAVGLHMTGRPEWVESHNDEWVSLLCKHYGLDKKQNRRPATWGQAPTPKPAQEQPQP